MDLRNQDEFNIFMNREEEEEEIKDFIFKWISFLLYFVQVKVNIYL